MAPPAGDHGKRHQHADYSLSRRTGGIPYQVEFTIPTIDLFPPDAAPSPLPPRPQPVHRKDHCPHNVGCMTWSTTGSATGVVQMNLNPVSFELNV
jgi:hypothetical protein